MARNLLLELCLYLLPFALYFGVRALMRRLNSERDGEASDALKAARPPWLLLTGTGLILAVIGFIAIFLDLTGPREGVYIPSKLEDGKIIPGGIAPKPLPAPAPKKESELEGGAG